MSKVDGWLLENRIELTRTKREINNVGDCGNENWSTEIDLCRYTGCIVLSIEAFLLTAQLRWTGHVTRMDHHRLPRVIFYGQLQQGEHSRGGQRKRYKDALKANLNTMGIKPADLEGLAADRTTWRATCQQAVVNFEESRVRHLEDKRRQRKTGQVNTSASVTCAEESAAPRSDCSPTDELIRDQRSVVSMAQSIHTY